MNLKVADKLRDAMTAGRVYRRRELSHLTNNLTRDLEKLVQEGKVIRAAAGLYYRPVMGEFGARPASVRSLMRAFLNDDRFLVTSFNDYSSLGVGLTQLYHQTIVYNRKRHGDFVLDGLRYSFRRSKGFPKSISKEFLFVDLLNNRSELAEDVSRLDELITAQVRHVDKRAVLSFARSYGKIGTRKFLENALGQ